MKILSIGEILWDTAGGPNSLGGAPLNFCASSVLLGNQAALISAVGEDAQGVLALEQIEVRGVNTSLIQVTQYPTGSISNEEAATANPHCRILHPSAYEALQFDAALLSCVKLMQPDWLYIGTLFNVDPERERFTRELAQHLPDVKVFYDANLRAGEWNSDVVKRLSCLSDVLKVNEREAKILARTLGCPIHPFSIPDWCKAFADQFDIDCICVTRGEEGCVVYCGGQVFEAVSQPVEVVDVIGAGDAFAAGFLHGYHSGWNLLDAMRLGNALGALNVSQRGALPAWTDTQYREMLSRQLVLA